jgi:hypothetical protein
MWRNGRSFAEGAIVAWEAWQQHKTRHESHHSHASSQKSQSQPKHDDGSRLQAPSVNTKYTEILYRVAPVDIFQSGRVSVELLFCCVCEKKSQSGFGFLQKNWCTHVSERARS